MNLLCLVGFSQTLLCSGWALSLMCTLPALLILLHLRLWLTCNKTFPFYHIIKHFSFRINTYASWESEQLQILNLETQLYLFTLENSKRINMLYLSDFKYLHPQKFTNRIRNSKRSLCLRKKLFDALNEFCMESSLHGLKYIREPRLPLADRYEENILYII